jgi:AAA15 family ATPase/GTPase
MPRITSFSLENFRVFEQKTTFEFAPITILTGANNSGKSSVFKALNLLSENAKKGNFFEELDFLLGNHNLGDFKNSITKKSNKEEISFEFGVNVKWSKYTDTRGEYKLEFVFLNVKDESQDDYFDANLESQIKNYKICFSYSKNKLVSINIRDNKGETLVTFSVYQPQNVKSNLVEFSLQLFLDKIIFENNLIYSENILNIEKLDKIIRENPKKVQFYEILNKRIKHFMIHSNQERFFINQINGDISYEYTYFKERLKRGVENFFIFIERGISDKYIYETENEFKNRTKYNFEENLEYSAENYIFGSDYTEFESILKSCGGLQVYDIINKDFVEYCDVV